MNRSGASDSWTIIRRTSSAMMSSPMCLGHLYSHRRTSEHGRIGYSGMLSVQGLRSFSCEACCVFYYGSVLDGKRASAKRSQCISDSEKLLEHLDEICARLDSLKAIDRNREK